MARPSSFDAKLKTGFAALPPQLKEAARWVIDHPADVALLSMREQARRAGIPPATLTRLAQRFGLRGYDGVRMLYADAVRQRPESYRGRAEELLVRRDSEGDAGPGAGYFCLAHPAPAGTLAARRRSSASPRPPI